MILLNVIKLPALVGIIIAWLSDFVLFQRSLKELKQSKVELGDRKCSGANYWYYITQITVNMEINLLSSNLVFLNISSGTSFP